MRKSRILVLAMLLCLICTSDIWATTASKQEQNAPGVQMKPMVTARPNAENCVHKYNNLILHISNWGFFGGLDGDFPDCEAGDSYLSGEFPAGSNVEYLYQGALWLGAVIGEDTLVSVGADGWYATNEMWPCADPSCGIERMSNRPSDLYFDQEANSDLEYIAVYTDTLTARNWVDQDPWDRRAHAPLNIEISQRTYSWSVEYAQDFILLDFVIRNIGSDQIKNLYLGIYSDGDVGHISRASDRYLDDICGFVASLPSRVGHGFTDELNMTYICDNDGDPEDGSYGITSATGVLATTVMRAPGENKVSFNWWTSNQNIALDWGPMLEANYRSFPSGGLGTPVGDVIKYYVLSNGEQDYDQVFGAMDFSKDGWLPPNPAVSQNIASGGDTRFLLSFGPFDIERYDSLNLTCAYIAGEALHRDPYAFETHMDQTPPDPGSFLSKLDFTDIHENAIWAQWVYDNPGVDTDGDGNFGLFWELVDTLSDGTIKVDTFWYAGDGVPDFRAATAPPPPVVRFTTTVRGVKLRWNGLVSETTEDPFIRVSDFEGYRVYMGRLKTISSMALLESRDLLDFKRFYWDFDLRRWHTRDEPFTLAELQRDYGTAFDPANFPCDCDSACDGDGMVVGDTTYCFEPVDWNKSIEGWLDGAVLTERTGIRKTFIDDIIAGRVTDTIDIEDTLTSFNWFRDIDPTTGNYTYYHKFYEYEFEIDNILPSVPWYFSVTTFDFGDFTNNLESMESSPLANVVEVWAMNDASVVVEKKLDPEVYPNPYIGDGRYWDSQYEDPSRTGFIDHERRIHFINLPYKCIIRIYTLSGDLVKVLEHPGASSDTDSRVQWNMRSRNNELVASGIYLYSVESELGNYVGKLVLIL